ncbi:MAG: STAS domain-containing protein, partial [Solirubrobacteraceae bacterium]
HGNCGGAVDQLGEPGDGQLTIELGETVNGSLLVKLGGELDISAVPRLEEALAPTISAGLQRLVIDVGDLEFADSSAIALWLKWANSVPEVELREPSELLIRVIARMGLSDRLGVNR